MNTTISIIGAGNLGTAIARGLVQSKQVVAKSIVISRRTVEKLDELRSEGFSVTNSNVKAIKKSEIIILCVQPKQLDGVLTELKPFLDPKKHILVSTITGVTTEEIAKMVGKPIAIVRAMPNTAISLGASMTCICSKNTTLKQMEKIQSLFENLGRTLIIEETQMKAATVLAASGIAFFMRYIRAITQAGIQLGFDAEEAQLIAMQTASGGASLLLGNKSHPELEIDKVTTPQGCTIAGLNEMEHQGLSSALIKGVLCSFEKINNIRN